MPLTLHLCSRPALRSSNRVELFYSLTNTEQEQCTGNWSIELPPRLSPDNNARMSGQIAMGAGTTEEVTSFGATLVEGTDSGGQELILHATVGWPSIQTTIVEERVHLQALEPCR